MRVCSLNVHLWSDRRGRSNTDRVIEFLRALECEVVALQEVLRDGPQLERVALALGMHRAFGAESWLGNALLSAAPLDAIDPAPITAGLEEGRCALFAATGTPDERIDVCSIHLAADSEATRLRQLDRAVGVMARRSPCHLVLGDFNALRLTDYPPDGLASIRARRAEHDREEPRGEVIERMDALGYVDLYRLARARDLESYREHLAGPLPDGARATCWTGTRVDYVWASPAMAGRWAVTSAEAVETDASDHHAVVVELARSAMSP
jgi:endonuclease/exonuclease/phosphatase family metal-dependent hydrolase